MRTTCVLICCLCLLIAVPVNAQQGSQPSIHDNKFDEYGNLSLLDEKKRLDELAAHLRTSTDYIAYLDVYAGRKACIGEAKNRARRAKKYLVERWGISGGRIVWRDGGHREEWTVEIWLVPRGGAAPPAFPTVASREVQLTGHCKAEGRNRGVRGANKAAPDIKFESQH